MDCNKLYEICLKYYTKNNDCKDIYVRCKDRKSIKKRKSLPIRLNSKIYVKGESGVFSSNGR